jgi:hypothetical protein
MQDFQSTQLKLVAINPKQSHFMELGKFWQQN